MDVRQLEYLLVIERCGSISAAAEAIHISQPALSQSLQKVEKQVGVPLFQRVDKKMIPTEAGKYYLAGAREMVKIKKETFSKIVELIHQKKNTISLSLCPQVYQTCGKVVMEHCLTLTEDIQFQELGTRIAREYLCNDFLDAAVICFNGKPDSALTIQKLYEEELYLVVPNAYAWEGTAVDPEALGRCPFASVQEDNFLASFNRQVISDPCFTASVDYRVESLHNIHILVENGYAAALVPGRMAQLMHDCRFYEWHTHPKYEVSFAFSKYSPKKEILRQLMQALREVF